jgi:hypothetical protein
VRRSELPERFPVDRVETILARIPQVRWFGAAGLGAESEISGAAARGYVAACNQSLALHWAADWNEARQVVRGLDDELSFWRQEETWRRHAAEAAEAAGRSEQLAAAMHRLSVAGYEAVRPVLGDEELARVASGAALCTAGAALTWSVVEDLLSPQPNPFLAKLRLFELGHWPLGKWQGAIVVL